MPRNRTLVTSRGTGRRPPTPPCQWGPAAFRRRHDGRVERSGFEARLGVRRLLRILSRPLHGRVFRSAARRLPRARALAVARRVHRDVQQERRRAAARGPPEPEPRRRRLGSPHRGSSTSCTPPRRFSSPPVSTGGWGSSSMPRRRERGGPSSDVSTASADGMTRRRGASHQPSQPTPSFQPPASRPAPPHPARPRRRARRRARGEPPHSRGHPNPDARRVPSAPLPRPLRRLRGTRPSGRASPRGGRGDPNARNNTGVTPTHNAASWRPSRIASRLSMSAGAAWCGYGTWTMSRRHRDRTPRHRSPPSGGCGP